MVGEVNGGWTVAKALLGHERTMIADAFGSARRRRRQARQPPRGARAHATLGERGRARSPTRCCATQIAQLEMDERAFALTVQRSRDAAKAGHQPGPRELDLQGLRHRAEQAPPRAAGARSPGPQALGWEGPGFDDDELALTRDWLRSRGNTIEGGTSEVQLNIIAKRVLGLPD